MCEISVPVPVPDSCALANGKKERKAEGIGRVGRDGKERRDGGSEGTFTANISR